MKKIFTTFFFASVSCVLFAQNSFEKAKYLYDNQYYADAAVAYTKVVEKIEKDKTRGEVYAKIGNSYYYTQKFSDAEKWFKKADEIGFASGEYYMNYGEVKMFNADYPSAAKLFEKAKLADNTLEILANARIQACSSAQQKVEQPSLYAHKSVDALNSKFNDYGMSKMGDKYIVSSARKLSDTTKTDQKSGQGPHKLYNTSNSGDSWKFESKLPEDIFGVYNNGTFSFHEGSNTAYYTLCNGFDGKGKTCKIYSTQYNGSTWSKPEELNFNSDEYNCSQPSISTDGNTIYFSSDKTGGLGQKDIYKASKGAANAWKEPVNAGKEINSAGDDVFPVLIGDSLLVFSTDGRDGMGGLDLYQAAIKKNIIQKAVWLEMPFNSSGDDFNLVYGKTNREGFYCSNRAGGNGGDDIYSFSLDQTLFGMGGDVREVGSGKLLSNANIVITGSDGSKKELKSDYNGVFSMPEASPLVEYTIRVSKPEYFTRVFVIPAIEGDNAEASRKERNNVMLSLSKTPLTADEEIKLDNIYFEYNKADLTPSSKEELRNLVSLLNENPTVDIAINAHSDEQGEEQYNMELSHRRAQSVVDFLVLSGVNRSRLLARGWGESRPMIKNASSEDQHAANRRTTFQVTNPSPKLN